MPVEYVKPKQFAAMFRLSEQAVTAMCRRGELNARRLGKQWRIPIEKEKESAVAATDSTGPAEGDQTHD